MRGRCPDDWSRIDKFLNWWARVRTNADWLPDGDIWIAILALFMSTSGQETTLSGRCINLPMFWTWKESEADRSLMDVRTGCWDVQMDASWNRSFLIQWRVQTERYVVRMDDAGLSGVRTVWHVVWTNGAVDRWVSGQDNTSSGWLTGNLKSSIFFRSAESSKNALTSGISIYSMFTHKWFCPNTEWCQNTNKLPLWPFWDKNHLTSLEIHSRFKNKNYSPFLSQRDKG
jgi:hypothetical protein